MKGKRSILVVDDDLAHRTMLRILLGWQYDIVEADCGSEAIEKIRKTSFDLVLMDVFMPGISGVEALDKIKMTNPKIPVVMMTAYSSNETAAEALKKGAYDYLTKPFDFENLRLTIEKAMAHAWMPLEKKYKADLSGWVFNIHIDGYQPVKTGEFFRTFASR